MALTQWASEGGGVQQFNNQYIHSKYNVQFIPQLRITKDSFLDNLCL